MYVHTWRAREGDWEEDRQLLLCVYRITKHLTTGLSPYEVLFGVDPPSLSVLRLPGTAVSEALEYSGSLKPMILELREMLEANIVESAKQLCQSYQGEGTCEKLQIGQRVLLGNPARGKLDTHWTEPWTVVNLRKPSTVLLKVGTAIKRMHLNRVRPLLPELADNRDQVVPGDWTPPLFQEGGLPFLIRCRDPDDSTSINDDASATVSTPVEFASLMVQNPNVLRQEASGSSNDNATILSTHSGRVVKAVQCS